MSIVVLHDGIWHLLVFLGLTLAVVGMTLLASHLLGERHRERATARPYESGVVSTGSARLRFDVQFYLIAMFFVIFDVEAVFVLSWAVVVRDVGWVGYAEAAVFVAVLFAGLLYVWRRGGLDWRARRRNRISPGSTP